MRYSLLLIVLLAACGDDSTGSDVTCADVCASVDSVCGFTPPGCAESCAAVSQTARRCVVSASTCEQVDACGGDDAGAMDSGGMDVGSTDAGSEPDAGAECTIGEVESCPAPSVSCTNAIVNGTGWCSPVCDDDSDCGEFVCNGSGGYCVPGCTSTNPSCPSPFTECEVGLGGTGYCR